MRITKIQLTKVGRERARSQFGITFLEKGRDIATNIIPDKKYSISDNGDFDYKFTFSSMFIAVSKVDQSKPFAVGYFGDFNGYNTYEFATASNDIKDLIDVFNEYDQQEAVVEVYNPITGLVNIFTAYPHGNEYTNESVGLDGNKFEDGGRTQREYSTDLILKLKKIVDEHNNGRSFDRMYYIVDVTGDKEVYFTLYRYVKPTSGYVNPYKYIKNMSIDLEKAVNDIHRLPMPVLVNYTDNNNPLLVNFKKRSKEGVPNIPFGKYKGEPLADVWEKDRNWVMWFYKNYKTEQFKDPSVRYRTAKWTEEDILLKEQAEQLIQLFWEEMAEQNRQTSTSKYFGEIGKRTVVDAKVTKIKKNNDYSTIYLETKDGDIVYIYDKDFKMEVGKTYSIKGTPTKHVEILGKKCTYLNRVDLIGEAATQFDDGGEINETEVNKATQDVAGIGVKKTLEDEAKKYKSAKDFVNAQKLVYHGSQVPLKRFSNKQGTFFTDDMMMADGYAGGEYVYEGYLNLKNALVIDAKGRKWDDLKTPYGESTQEIALNLDTKKYDGIVFENIKDSWIDDADYQDPATIYYVAKTGNSFLNESQLIELWNKAVKQPTLTPKFDDGGETNSILPAEKDTTDVVSEGLTFEEFYSEKAKNKLLPSETNYRSAIPNFRGSITKEKIKRVLTEMGASPSGERSFYREVLKFDTPQELEENLFYHGSAHGVGGLMPSIVIPYFDENYGGGGYGEKYWGISISKDKNIASNFTGLASYGSVAMVLIKKGAVIKRMPEIEDAVELEDKIEQLWKEGIDVVFIGKDWKDGYSEQEAVVLNPKAIVVGKSEGFKVFGKERFVNEDANKIFTEAPKKYKELYDVFQKQEDEKFKAKYGRDRASANSPKNKMLDYRNERNKLLDDFNKLSNEAVKQSAPQFKDGGETNAADGIAEYAILKKKIPVAQKIDGVNSHEITTTKEVAAILGISTAKAFDVMVKLEKEGVAFRYGYRTKGGWEDADNSGLKSRSLGWSLYSSPEFADGGETKTADFLVNCDLFGYVPDFEYDEFGNPFGSDKVVYFNTLSEAFNSMFKYLKSNQGKESISDGGNFEIIKVTERDSEGYMNKAKTVYKISNRELKSLLASNKLKDGGVIDLMWRDFMTGKKVDNINVDSLKLMRAGEEFSDKSRGGDWYEFDAGQKPYFKGDKRIGGVGGNKIHRKEISLKNPYYFDTSLILESGQTPKLYEELFHKKFPLLPATEWADGELEKYYAKAELAIATELGKQGYDGVIFIKNADGVDDGKKYIGDVFKINPELVKRIADGGITNEQKTKYMDSVKFAQMPDVNEIKVGKNIILKDEVFAQTGGVLKHAGTRYSSCEIIGNGSVKKNIKLRVIKSAGTQPLHPNDVIERPVANVLLNGRELPSQHIASAPDTKNQKHGMDDVYTGDEVSYKGANYAVGGMTEDRNFIRAKRADGNEENIALDDFMDNATLIKRK